MTRLAFAPFALSLLAGCGPSAATFKEAEVPKYDAEAISKAALTEFDKDGNGGIDVNEARACPALTGAFAAIDSNNDKKITGDELRKRIESYAKGPTGSVPISCTVKFDGALLADATVTFTPENCMGGAIKPATAKTAKDGRCTEYQIDGKTFRGLGAGLYKIEVTKDGTAIPARYNTQTTLGKEVFHDTRMGEIMVELNLMSK